MPDNPSVSGRPARFHCLYLVITDQCNLRCRYCYQNAKKEQRMGWEVLQAGIDLAFRNSSSQTDLIFSGGEPLLESALMRQTVEYGKHLDPEGRRFRYMLVTNGLLLSKELTDFLAEHKFYVQLSFDGIRAAQSYRSAGTFEVLDGKVDWIRATYPEFFGNALRVVLTVIPPTVTFMADSVEYLVNKGMREISIAAGLLPYHGWESGAAVELTGQFARISDLCKRTLEETGHVPVSALRRFAGEVTGARQWPPACNALTGRTLTLDTDGQVYTCPMFVQSYQEFPPESLMARLRLVHLGHVQDPELSERSAALPEAVRSSGLMDYRTDLRSSYGKCSDCRYLGRCTICPVSVWHSAGEGGPFRVPDFLCAFNRTALDARDSFPCMPQPAAMQTGANTGPRR